MRNPENVYNNKHCFAVSAYKESPYLENCIRSLMAQTVMSKIIICTSTPNEYIRTMAEKYKLELYVRDGESDIREDWNFAYNMADSEYVTIAHQDDLYSKRYVEKLLENLSAYNSTNTVKRLPVIMFLSDYLPIRHGKADKNDINRKLRRLLRVPLKNRCLAGKRIVKKLVLSLGNSIVCPSVTYNKRLLGKNIFTTDLKFNIDWDTFLTLGKHKGVFLYCDYPLVCYRIHDGATSKEFIDNSKRYDEDTIMFKKFWPDSIVRLIMRFYVKAYDTYK